ncbi:sugar-binding transcriptional regulator [Mammaliicoccus stepanovicii]|uniref:Transcriptional regulator n=1 Tax=Mammaliicoccus stepanovicii TaxID=643214 RepID=A0A239ZXB6_9STAP|nr:sugar-binding domain-containing protein [Mammaliicoccus stepanovicii]PNZ79296.1 hypothetical protein CD111_00230 [Mammaliicoccus stepanovicii]GGI39183.1 transcriptional regulator [Mammaliicoccus stepanovicii]SNV75657.1 transcriptional regulator [Mammaliicoccus stepanovicii]
MEDLLKIQHRLVPDLIDKMYRRFNILCTIEKKQPIGRRSLSDVMNVTERVLRTEIEILKQQDLVSVQSTGMKLTDVGEQTLSSLAHYLTLYSSFNHLEEEFFNRYGVKVHIVRGNSDSDESVKAEMGNVTSELLEQALYDKATVSVTGGSTMAKVSESLHPLNKDIMFTPARGGLGENVVFQANTICASMANRTGGSYKVLYVPDQVSESSYETLLKEPAVIEVLDAIRHSDFIIHGIGDALKMAKRRKTSDEIIGQLQHHHAVGEAFGYYFDSKGEVVHRVKTIGMQLEDLVTKTNIFAVAGGASKAEAIKAYLEIAPKNTVLITDEKAAKAIINLE